ncbi:C2H2 and C2HC zinc fingers superfamily protein [Actinidia rufa]|uniref:C2H2 and C2HC zinc fingers superfamily protein n=1 Tax=Actinidia rufa TaxID=165716 RepID=A0A7J0GS17_9ERIC|nr:C2H2 and C2HC zinc fingers superfamily protein [Actinidia rufa]
MSNNITCLSHEEASSDPLSGLNPMVSTISLPHDHQHPQKIKKKRNLPGNPDPDAEVIALSPKSLMATNRCDCGTLFSRKDSFVTHRAFCDALAEESARLTANQFGNTTNTNTPQTDFHLHHPQNHHQPPSLFPFQNQQQVHISLNHHPWDPPPPNPNPSLTQTPLPHHIKPETIHLPLPPPPLSSSSFFQLSPNSAMSSHLSATALLQKAATVGAQSIGHVASTMTGVSPEYLGFAATWQKNDRLTRDFLGLTGDQGGGGDANVNVRNMLMFTGGVEFPTTAYERDHTLLKAQGFGFAEPPAF